MIALAILFFLALYLLISIGMIWLVTRWAGKRGRSKWRWGLFAAFVMYNLVFWDLIPTYVVYKYYAHTKAGFWVYKTPEQWKEENPGVAETLTWKDMPDDYKGSGKFAGYEGYKLNERILWLGKGVRNSSNSLIPVGISEDLIIDSMTGKILVKKANVWSGGDGQEFTRFWTSLGRTAPGDNEFVVLESKYERIGREVQ